MDSDILDCNKFYKHFFGLFEKITAHPYNQTELFLSQTAIIADELPKIIRQQLQAFYQRGNNSGVLLLTGCPEEPNIDKIPTPQGISEKSTFISEYCLALIGAKLGDIFGYKQIEEGSLFHNITPTPAMKYQQSSASSMVELQFHTEQHFHPYSPDYVLLYCLRSQSQAATFYASVRQLMAELDENYQKILFEPLYKTGIDFIFGNSLTERGNGSVKPVLYGNQKDPFLCYDQDLMIGLTPQAQDALNALHLVLQKVKKSVSLNPGELLLIDNRRAVHGRYPFKPNFDGKDRWLQRAKIMRDLDKASADCNLTERIIHTQFSVHSYPNPSLN